LSITLLPPVTHLQAAPRAWRAAVPLPAWGAASQWRCVSGAALSSGASWTRWGSPAERRSGEGECGRATGPGLSAGDQVYQQGTRFISRGPGLSAGDHRGDSIRRVGTHIQGISTDGKGMATQCRRGVWEGCAGTTNRGPPDHPLTRDSWSISCTTGSMQDHMGV
jgi:hypothetical protein